MKLLTICPSRNRPDRLKQMLNSHDTTKRGDSEIIVYVAFDDPQIGRYEDILSGRPHIFGPRRALVEVINYIALERMPDLDYYQEINDDHYYITDGWDQKLIASIENGGAKFGIAWGQDGIGNTEHSHGLPTAVVMSGPMLRTLGYFFPPGLKQTYCDNALLDIGRDTKTIYYNPKVVIEHRHCLVGKAPMDSNYKRVMSHELLSEGKRIYEEWLVSSRAKDTERLNNAIKNWRTNKVL